mmetsp:Transcript_28020/g.68107  ORF Transcript_28020/g.68107 Transcript_28020/m.68107 type:complete len:264 (+) Transcript_28020:1963-2754(+)
MTILRSAPPSNSGGTCLSLNHFIFAGKLRVKKGGSPWNVLSKAILQKHLGDVALWVSSEDKAPIQVSMFVDTVGDKVHIALQQSLGHVVLGIECDWVDFLIALFALAALLRNGGAAAQDTAEVDVEELVLQVWRRNFDRDERAVVHVIDDNRHGLSFVLEVKVEGVWLKVHGTNHGFWGDALGMHTTSGGFGLCLKSKKGLTIRMHLSVFVGGRLHGCVSGRDNRFRDAVPAQCQVAVLTTSGSMLHGKSDLFANEHLAKVFS